MKTSITERNDIHMRILLTLSVLVLTLVGNVASAGSSVWDKSNETYTGSKEITVYRDPNCSCCSAWIKHLEKHDFKVIDIKSNDMNAVKRRLNVPQKLASCHTATIGGYVIEGHVPADDIKRLLKKKPNFVGLTVPEMPVGPPGMERGNKKDPFAVIKFDAEGNSDSFNEYWSY